VGLDLRTQQRDETAVDFHRGDLRTGLDQRQGERTEPGPDLDDLCPGLDPRQPGDAADRVGVDDEVLAQGAAGPQAVAVEDVSDLTARERHATNGADPEPSGTLTS